MRRDKLSSRISQYTKEKKKISIHMILLSLFNKNHNYLYENIKFVV